MKMFLFLLLMPNLSHADCIREITVQEYKYRSNPNPFQKVKEPYTKGEKKNVFIDCELYKDIKVGDELTEPGDNVDRIRLFSGDNGVLERKRYKVLKK